MCMNYPQFNAYKAYMLKLSKTATLKKTKNCFSRPIIANEGQKYCRILSTFIKLPLVIMICILSIFEWPLKTGFTV